MSWQNITTLTRTTHSSLKTSEGLRRPQSVCWDYRFCRNHAVIAEIIESLRRPPRVYQDKKSFAETRVYWDNIDYIGPHRSLQNHIELTKTTETLLRKPQKISWDHKPFGEDNRVCSLLYIVFNIETRRQRNYFIRISIWMVSTLQKACLVACTGVHQRPTPLCTHLAPTSTQSTHKKPLFLFY